MMVDTTIYGYASDGGVYHVRCLEDASQRHALAQIHSLTYLDDEDPHGLTCYECSEYIFEPVAVHPYSPQEGYDGCRECSSDDYCGEFEECELHKRSDGSPDPGYLPYDPDDDSTKTPERGYR
jgi:hypothetical protein